LFHAHRAATDVKEEELMSTEKIHTLGIRINSEAYEKLQRLATATERSKGAVVRLLIKNAGLSDIRGIYLVPSGQHDAAQAGQRAQDRAPEAATQ
jgi:predicted DNA-binding protein